MPKHIINVDELDYKPSPAPIPDHLKDKYEGATIGFAGTLIGAQKLGYNVTVLPPGKRAFPFHSHQVNEELFFVLEGNGEVRIGKETLPIKKGDFISCPPGNGDTAHQIINSSSEELRYIALSTKLSPEVAEYPDSGKFGMLAQGMRFLGKVDQSLDYWDGE